MYDPYTYRHPRTIEQAFGCRPAVSVHIPATNAASIACYVLAGLIVLATIVLALV